jgi:hypothetical protein
MILVNDVRDSKMAFTATVLELVVNTTSLFKALGSTHISHAWNISRGALLCRCHRHCGHPGVLVEQERLKLPSFLVWGHLRM